MLEIARLDGGMVAWWGTEQPREKHDMHYNSATLGTASK